MKKQITSLVFGSVCISALAAAFLIGSSNPYSFGDASTGFLLNLLFIGAIPLVTGLTFLGITQRPILAAAGSSLHTPGRSGARNLAIVALIIAIVLGGAALALSLTNYYSTSNNQNNSNLNSKIQGAYADVNATPGVVAVKIQWCLQQVVQDRFCPGNIVVEQGDIVQVLFIQNDTADHTFTLLTPPYDFQINDSGAGQLDFLNNYIPVAGACSNAGTFTQISSVISGSYCVSGTSLLSNATLTAHGAIDFNVAQNPNPGLPMTSGNQTVQGEPPGVTLTNPTLILLPVNDQANMLSLTTAPINSSLPNVGVNLGGSSETQGIGAFWATQPGIYEFFCHYHVSNGMYGYLTVLPNLYCENNPSSCGIT